MRKDELKDLDMEIWDTIEFARHTFTGVLLCDWYTVTCPDTKSVHNYNILHITDINLYFVIYNFCEYRKVNVGRCAIAATYNLELARNILSIAATQSQLALLGYVPELQGISGSMVRQAFAAWDDLIDHNKVPLTDDDLADFEVAAIAVVRDAIRKLGL